MSKNRPASPEEEDRDEVIGLIEESVHVLRACPARSWLTYFTGTVPFLACLVVFWAEMANSGLAHRMLPVGALAVALSYLWMKCWQAYWIITVRNTVVRDNKVLTPRQRLAIARRQITLQPWGLIVFPVSMLLLIPYPWVLAYFQNLTVCEGLDDMGERTVSGKAARFAGIELKQLILFSLLWVKLLVIFVLLNWLTVLALLPYLLLTLFGMESEFVRSPYALLSNSTYYIAALALTYLTLDPLLKVFFFLRCYYAESLTTGLDIHVRLKRFISRAATALILLSLTSVLLPPATAAADTIDTLEVSPFDNFASTKHEVSLQKKYIWRHPPDTIMRNDSMPGWAETVRSYVTAAMDVLHDVVESVIKTIRDIFLSSDPKMKNTGDRTKALTDMITVVLVGLVIILAVLTTLILVRSIRRRQPVQQATQTNPAAVEAPDLSREDISADALPVQRWLAYARDLAAEGNYRLAIRAMFLAQIALLSDKHLIVIARYKSNRDYAGELARRAHAFPTIEESFSKSSRVFESIWYGDYNSGIEQYHELEHQFYRLDKQT